MPSRAWWEPPLIVAMARPHDVGRRYVAYHMLAEREVPYRVLRAVAADEWVARWGLPLPAGQWYCYEVSVD